MLINRLAISAALIVALIGSAKALEAFELIDGKLEGAEECLQLNNISPDEYLNFTEFDNIENLLNETVDLKYKCHFKCVMERQPQNWLNSQGKMDLKLMNVTDSEAAVKITKCMDQAVDEPCAYTFKLVICAFKNDILTPDYDTSYDYVEETSTELGQ